MKRLLFLVHRWGGVALALVMALWFFSGLVIGGARTVVRHHRRRPAFAGA